MGDIKMTPGQYKLAGQSAAWAMNPTDPSVVNPDDPSALMPGTFTPQSEFAAPTTPAANPQKFAPIQAGGQADPNDPTAGMSAMDGALYRFNHGLPMSTGDMTMLDNALSDRGLMKGASSTTSSTSRANQPHGPEWDALQTEAKTGLKNRSDIREHEAGNAVSAANANNQQYVQSAAEAEAHGQELQTMAARQTVADASYQADLDKLSSQQSAAHRDYLKASQSYDPNRLMKGGHGAMAALAMAFGAAGAALSHTTNSAMEIINGMIERDIDKQKMGIANKKEEVTWLDHVKSDVRTRFSDENAARLATRSAAKEVWAQQADSHAAKVSGNNALQLGAQMSSQFRMDAAQDAQRANELEMAARRAAAGTTSSSTTTQSSGTSPVDVMARIKAEADAKLARDKAMGGPGSTKLSPADASFTNKQLGKLAELGSAQSQFADLQKLNKDTGFVSRATGVGKGNEQNKAEQSAEQTYAQAVSGTQVSDTEHKRLSKQVGGGTFDWSGDAKNVGVNELRKNIVRKAIAEFQSIPDAAKPAALERMKGFGFSDEDISAIESGGRNSSSRTAAALGAQDTE